MIVAHRIQLFPNNHQAAFFKQACGTARFCYNWALAEWKRQYEAGEKPSAFSLNKQFNAIKKEQYPWTYDVHSHAQQQAFVDLGKAFQNFFRRVKQGGEKPGYPKFKAKHHRASFYMANTEFKIAGNHLILPKKKGAVRLREPLRFKGKIMSARISLEIDKWFAAISVDVPDASPKRDPEQFPIAGLNFGVARLATLSDGRMINGTKHYNTAQARLKKLQRQTRPGKHQKGSRRYQKAQLRVTKQHQRIRHLRENELHQITDKLTDLYPRIAIEGWSVKALTQSARGSVDAPGKNVALQSKFNRHMLDRGIGEARRQLEYKAAQKGGQIIVLPPEETTNRTCSRCGHIHPQQPLLTPLFQCPACGLTIDRDYNSSIVIAAKATGGAPESNGRGVDGTASLSSESTSHDETSTQQRSDER